MSAAVSQEAVLNNDACMHIWGLDCDVCSRVMTVSFHRYGQLFFPGTGSIDEIGFGAGKHYTLNIPFESGLTDSQFWSVFQPVMQKVMEVYQPGAVVLQCGVFAKGPSSHRMHTCFPPNLVASTCIVVNCPVESSSTSFPDLVVSLLVCKSITCKGM